MGYSQRSLHSGGAPPKALGSAPCPSLGIQHQQESCATPTSDSQETPQVFFALGLWNGIYLTGYLYGIGGRGNP